MLIDISRMAGFAHVDQTFHDGGFCQSAFVILGLFIITLFLPVLLPSRFLMIHFNDGL